MSVRPLLFVLAVSAAPAGAATLFVASDGADGPGCGSRTVPCRSIDEAIDRAADYDTIRVGPGRYGDVNGDGMLAGPGEDGCSDCPCVVEVWKPLEIVSERGAEHTIIDAAGASDDGVCLAGDEADGSVFGRRHRGFTIEGATDFGVSVYGGRRGIRVSGNVSRGHGVAGFLVSGSPPGSAETVLSYNRATGNGEFGFFFYGWERGDTPVRLLRNVASDNQYGFGVALGGPTLEGNLAFDNDVGFGFDRADGELRTCSSVRNREAGILLFRDSDVEIRACNLAGNGGAENCGLRNQTGDPASAKRIYWGASSGPGADPADAVCDEAGSQTSVGPFARRRVPRAPALRP